MVPLNDWQKMFINRRNQNFMTDVRQYAASLTNSWGGILEPETLFVKRGGEKNANRTSESKHHVKEKCKDTRPKQGPLPSRQNKGGKRETLSVKEQAALLQQSKHNESVKKHKSSWRSMVETFEKERCHATRYMKAKQYLSSLQGEKRSTLEVEILVYLVSTLVLSWKEKCDTNQRGSSVVVVALVWHTIQQIAKTRQVMTKETALCIQETIKVLGLPSLTLESQEKGGLSFQYAPFATKKATMNIGMSPIEFQLIHAGPYLDRSMGSVPDPRVHDFEPDKWQRDILDEIDARRSLFVVAPTSAGKTFISFYAIKQVLEDDNNGILVYVAPTKALVNQIAAEVPARFSKSFGNIPGKSVWAIHTRDYRINNPTGCQVLITVPHILQIMLLSPSNAKSWSSRVKRIIFDEIHCIGQAQDGVVWEQLLLLAPCPIIALSATVGNPQAFNNWLGLTQAANGIELKMIEHRMRYSDLRKYTHQPPEKFVFNGLSTPTQIATLGLDESPNLDFLHPVASLIDRARGFPDDLTLEPRDCWTLWKAMEKHKSEEFPVDRSLDPNIALPPVVTKAHILQWEAQLKAVLREWMNHPKSPFDAVIEDLSLRLHGTRGSKLQVSSGNLGDSATPHSLNKNNLLETTLPLICSLHDQGALPALIFNYDRSYCEKICEHLLHQLQDSEDRWKATSPVWEKRLSAWRAWRKTDAKQKRHRGPNEKEKRSQVEQIRENASKESNMYKSFDPNDPVEGFHLADIKKLTPSEFQEYATQLRYRLVPEWLIDALRRGIGVHHAGMNRKYRQVCEILFRKRYLRVVIATGTLALGINMPCKTVVFAGDSVYLTALSFRQAAGRAGRRGFDFLGNVVFQGIPRAKVCRLLSSRLPDLNGHFPITTSLVLRLFILLHESGQSPYAVKAVNSILSCPRIYLGGPESKHTVLHHLRFSIEYLHRNHLLDQAGAPLNIAGTISHLYYTESSSFAFHALLSEGYFHRLCRDIDQRPDETLLTLMLVMSHLFGRYQLRPNVLESLGTAEKKSPSIIVLPPLPKKAEKILGSHNMKTLRIYSGYMTTFIEQHIHDPDCVLPLTGVRCGGEQSASEISSSMKFLSPPKVNSAFVALSGHRDKWNSISELCSMVRSGVWLEESVIPHVEVSPGLGKSPLNGYLYDFFKHGNIHALVTGNRIRRGDIWFLLNDFSLVLATIVTSFENFLKLSPNADLDMLDTMGGGDRMEEDLENKMVEVDGNLPGLSPSNRASGYVKNQAPATLANPLPTKMKNGPVADNLDDDLSDEDREKENAIPETLHGALKQNQKEKKKREAEQEG